MAAHNHNAEAAFTDVASEKLEEAGEIATFEPSAFESANGSMRVDGYFFDEADDSLRLFLVNWRGSTDLQTLGQLEAKALFKRLLRFADAAISNRLDLAESRSSEVGDLASLIRERLATLAKIRAYLLTDRSLSSRVKDWPEGELNGVPCDFHIWDISRFHRAYTSISGLDELVVDFTIGSEPGVPCLRASMSDSPYASYLCIVPASLLAAIYNAYGSRLLEGNVRAFLSSRGKINLGIRRTLIEQPEMFFAYNNGISAVASSVEVVQTPKGPMLISATDLQIVNGAQTTASIANVDRVDKAQRLSATFVPMKLSVVTGATASTMIADISKYANSQNKVSDADFFANHPFHQRLEQISRRLFVAAQRGQQYETRWYYERARGQYLNEFASMTAAQTDSLKLIIPKSQVFTKPDLAKSELSWQGRPHIVSQGAQKFFLEFAQAIDKAWTSNSEDFHEEYFRDVTARVLIFRRTEELISKQPWYYGGYRSIIVTYSLARLAREVSLKRSGVMDFGRIWRTQDVYLELLNQISTIAFDIFESLNALPMSQQNLTQWAKRLACWEQLQNIPVVLSARFMETLIDVADAAALSRSAKATQQIDSGIDSQSLVLAFGAGYWKSALHWAQARGGLSSLDQAALKEAAYAQGTVPSERQCKRLMVLKRRLEAAGFTTGLDSATSKTTI